MRRLFAGFIAAACFTGLLYHRLRRAGPMGGFICENCNRTFSDLDDAGEKGSGYVRPLRTTYSRDGAGGRAETTRGQDWLN